MANKQIYNCSIEQMNSIHVMSRRMVEVSVAARLAEVDKGCGRRLGLGVRFLQQQGRSKGDTR